MWLDLRSLWSGAGQTVAVPLATLTLSAFAPTVTVGGGGGSPVTVAVPLATLTLTGFAPVVRTPRTVQIPLGTLTLTPFAPTVLTPRVIQVPLATLTLQKFAPTVLTPRVVSIPLGTLNLTGFAPTVLAGAAQLLPIPLGTLTLQGFPPTVITSSGSQGFGPMGPSEPVRSMFHASHRKSKARKSPADEPARIDEITNPAEPPTTTLARAAPAIEAPAFAVPLTDLLDVQTRLELAARKLSAKAASDEHEQALLLAMIALWND